MKLPAGKLRLLRCVKKTSSGTRPGTGTTVQPVRAFSFSLSSSKLGTPGRERWSTSSPCWKASTARPWSRVCWRANNVSQTQWSSAVSSSQCCGTVQSAAAPGGGGGGATAPCRWAGAWLLLFWSIIRSFPKKKEPRLEDRAGFGRFVLVVESASVRIRPGGEIIISIGNAHGAGGRETVGNGDARGHAASLVRALDPVKRCAADVTRQRMNGCLMWPRRHAAPAGRSGWHCRAGRGRRQGG